MKKMKKYEYHGVASKAYKRDARAYSVESFEVMSYYFDDDNLKSIGDSEDLQDVAMSFMKKLGIDSVSCSPILYKEENWEDCSCIDDDARVSTDLVDAPEYVMHVVDTTNRKRAELFSDYCKHTVVYCFFAWYDDDVIYVRKHKAGECDLCQYKSQFEQDVKFTVRMTVDVSLKVVPDEDEDLLQTCIDQFKEHMEDRVEDACSDLEETLDYDNHRIDGYVNVKVKSNVVSAGR